MSLGETCRNVAGTERGSRKRAELLLLEIQDLGPQPPRMVKGNAPSTVAACVIQEAHWPACICPVMKSVINVDPK